MAKLRKKKLRAPDEFLRLTRSVYEWMQSRWVTSLILLGVVFFGVISFLYWQKIDQKKEAAAQYNYGELISIVEQWEIAPPENREQSLQEIQGIWTELKQSHHDSKSTDLAHLFMGRVAFVQEEFEQALVHFKKFEKIISNDYLGMALYPKAQTFEALKRWKEASSAYDRLLESDEASFKKWALLGKARSLRQQQQWQASLETYDQFLADFPNSPEATQVRGLKLLVEQQKET